MKTFMTDAMKLEKTLAGLKRYSVRPNREDQAYDVIGPDGYAVDQDDTWDGAVRLAAELEAEAG